MIHARTLLNFTEDQIWEWESQHRHDIPVEIEFDGVTVGGIPQDGMVIALPVTATVISWYLWELHRLYDELPILPEHHLGTSEFNSKSIVTQATKIVNTLVPIYWGRIDYQLLGKQIYSQVLNKLYNAVTVRLEEYVETMDAFTYINVLYHPEIDAIRTKAREEGSTKAIREVYELIPQTLKRPDFLPGNSLVGCLKLKSVPIGQILQCIGVRGRVTDIDSWIFPQPIFDCFGSGIRNIADFIIESRSAAKALFFQRDPIRDTEYFNRRLQILAQPVKFLIPGDCGTERTLAWHMQPGDLSAHDGMNYVGEDGKLYYIDAQSSASRKLTGTTVLLRSPLYCKHGKDGGVCEACFGRLAYTTAPGTNIGHQAAFITGERITQPVLGTKHLDNNAEAKEINLDKHDLRYITLAGARKELIKFTEFTLATGEPKLLLPVEDVGNLTQAMATEKLSELSIYKISKLFKIGIKYTHDDMEVTDWVNVSDPSRPSSLTIAFLEHIRKVGYYQLDAKYIEVPLTGWDRNLAAFQLPDKQTNMLDFMKQISNMLECGPREGVKKGLDPSNPDDLVTYLREVYEFSSQYINIPMIYLHILTLAIIIRSNANNDYRLADDFDSREFASSSNIMYNRSIGPALAYEEQANVLFNSISYNPHNRVAHPMDALFYPDPNASLYKDWKYPGKPIPRPQSQ